MNFKSVFAGVALLASFSAQAVVVDTSLWTLAVSPAAGAGPSGLTSAGGNQAVQNSNSFGSIISDFSFTGDFNFSGTMNATGSDDDIIGLVFGWQDASNHYRLGWERGGYNDAPTNASGMFLVKEVAGVSTVLFQQETFYTNNVDYNFIVGRAGNDISFSLNGISQSFTDTAFMSGHVGFYTESQTARFGGLASAPQAPNAAPVPAPMAMMGLGLLALAYSRKRKA